MLVRSQSSFDVEKEPLTQQHFIDDIETIIAERKEEFQNITVYTKDSNTACDFKSVPLPRNFIKALLPSILATLAERYRDKQKIQVLGVQHNSLIYNDPNESLLPTFVFRYKVLEDDGQYGPQQSALIDSAHGEIIDGKKILTRVSGGVYQYDQQTQPMAILPRDVLVSAWNNVSLEFKNRMIKNEFKVGFIGYHFPVQQQSEPIHINATSAADYSSMRRRSI